MWNDTAVCDDRMELKILVRDWYEMWKSLEKEFSMMF